MNTTLTKITSHTHTSKILGKTQALFLQNSENCFITHTERQDRQPPPDFLRKKSPTRQINKPKFYIIIIMYFQFSNS